MNKEFEKANLKIQCYLENGVLFMNWKGKSDIIDIVEFLNKYYDEIFSLEFNSVLANFTELDFMSSTTILMIIKLIKLLNEKRKNIKLVYLKDNSWHRESFDAIQLLSTKMENIEVITEYR